MSLVEVSPSTVSRLKERSVARRRISPSTSAGTAASVVTNARVVAMSGWIMPEPLTMPPIV